MTRKRYDTHSTEFGLWLRAQKDLASKDGYTATNIDYLWRHRRTGQWLLMEEKRYGAYPRPWQLHSFAIIDRLARTHDSNYCGFYVVVFENTSPQDGNLWINMISATRADVKAILQFDSAALARYRRPIEVLAAALRVSI
jgi:hypothetical protein